MAASQTFRSMIGIPDSTASTSDSVLVIIDAQNEYAEGKLKTINVEATRAAIASLLEKYRAADAPVIHVVHKTPDGAPVFTQGTALAQEFDELKPKDNESVLSKQFPSAFAGTSLQEILEATGRKKVVLVGYMVSCPTSPRSAMEHLPSCHTGSRMCLYDRSPGGRKRLGCHCGQGRGRRSTHPGCGRRTTG